MAELLQAPRLLEIDAVRHGFETRRASIEEILPHPAARVRQVHGADVVFLARPIDAQRCRSSSTTARPAADALVTGCRGITLAVATADCLPVLLADRHGAAIAAVHAGWRGLALGVLPTTVAIMVRELGVQPHECVAAIGPGIGRGAYRVGNDVRVAFRAAGIDAGVFSEPQPQTGEDTGHGSWLCDLAVAARLQLRACGLPDHGIEAIPACTFSDTERFHSWRRDGEAAGRMLAGIALVE